MNRGILGVIGGMGPQATLQFCQRLLDRTAAHSDQEHLPTLIWNDTQMPDRTAALLSGERKAVEERLLADAELLARQGATAIAITCNTAHAFLPAIEDRLPVPVVHMIDETAKELNALGAKRVGILGTDGTLQTGLYRNALERQGIEAVEPPPAAQKAVMTLIYDQIKAGQRGDEALFQRAAQTLREQGCDRIVLACTELSTYRDWHRLDEYFVDAMDVLACRCVERCGYLLKKA